MEKPLTESIIGCLIGTAVGDALGLPMEGLSRHRQMAMYPDLAGYHFLPGRGMVSDDTDHANLVAAALAASGGHAAEFGRQLAWGLRWWLASLPAGVGWATLRSLIKLWVGFGWAHSGVESAGNGPAMRSPLLGVCYGYDLPRMNELVRISTRVTHTDPKAEHGARAVAWAAYLASHHRDNPQDYMDTLPSVLGAGAEEMMAVLKMAAASAASGQSTTDFADQLGLKRGITGYMLHTVPVVIQAWLKHPRDIRNAVTGLIRCGGDTDTTAAILGGIVGAAVGRTGLPAEWLAGLWLWPKTMKWIENLGTILAEVVDTGIPHPAPPLAWWGIWPRNLFFLAIVLLHGFRRLGPPY